MSIEIGTQAPPLQLDADGVVRVAGTRVTLDSVVTAFSNGVDGSARRPLPRDSVDAPQRERVVGGPVLRRSPYRGDHQGGGEDGLAPLARQPRSLRGHVARASRRWRRATGGRGRSLRDVAPEAARRSRGGTHARPRSQLHRRLRWTRVGDGLSRTPGARYRRPARCERCLRARTRRLRRLGDTLGL